MQDIRPHPHILCEWATANIQQVTGTSLKNVWLDSGHSLYNRVTAEHNRSFRFCSNFIFLMDFFSNKVLRKVKIRRGQAGLIEFTQEFKMNCVVAPSRTLVTWAGLPLLFRLIHRQNCTTSRHAPIVLFPILELTFLEIGTQYVLLVCLCIAAGRSFSWIPEEEGMLTMRDERRNKER